MAKSQYRHAIETLEKREADLESDMERCDQDTIEALGWERKLKDVKDAIRLLKGTVMAS